MRGRGCWSPRGAIWQRWREDGRRGAPRATLLRGVMDTMNLRYFRAENARLFSGVRRIYNYFDYFVAHVFCECKQREYFYFRFYEKNIFEQNTFVTIRRYRRMRRTMLDLSQRSVLDNKVTFLNKYKDYAKREWIFLDECSFQEFCMFVDRHPEFIVKPIDLNQGQGIYKHRADESVESRLGLYDRLRASHYLLEELIVQHDVLNQLNPGSVNTVRIMTLLAAGKAHAFAAALKIGSERCVDDLRSSRGICAAIDLDTGIVVSKGMNVDLDVFTHHPKTGVRVIGVQLPYWSEVVDLVKVAAEQLPGVTLVGWDVAITATGCCLVEGNSGPGWFMVQAAENRGKYSVIKRLLQA
jgi:hypothetical protein